MIMTAVVVAVAVGGGIIIVLRGTDAAVTNPSACGAAC